MEFTTSYFALKSKGLELRCMDIVSNVLTNNIKKDRRNTEFLSAVFPAYRYGDKVVVTNNPLATYSNCIEYLKGKKNSFELDEMQKLFNVCRKEGLMLDVESEGVSRGDRTNPFYCVGICMEVSE